MGDHWAEVELYRWQHGELPPQEGSAYPLDISKGLAAMAEACAPEAEHHPAPFNVAEVLAFAGRKIAEFEKLINDPKALELTRAMVAGVDDACWQDKAEKAEKEVARLTDIIKYGCDAK